MMDGVLNQVFMSSNHSFVTLLKKLCLANSVGIIYSPSLPNWLVFPHSQQQRRPTKSSSSSHADLGCHMEFCPANRCA